MTEEFSDGSSIRVVCVKTETKGLREISLRVASVVPRGCGYILINSLKVDAASCVVSARARNRHGEICGFRGRAIVSCGHVAISEHREASHHIARPTTVN